MTPRPDAASVLRLYLDGVTAIEETAGALRPHDGTRPTPCEDWTVVDLVAHVRCVAEDYNDFLTALTAGRPTPLRLGEELARHNADRLRQVADDRVEPQLSVFGSAARRFADRVPAAWSATAYTLGGRSWTLGQYVGVCAVEWHVHTWDLARSIGRDHRPARANLLADAWRDGVPHLELPAGDPWPAVLAAAGRHVDR
jgi:uncharacterized protein (TIGR03083 family)